MTPGVEVEGPLGRKKHRSLMSNRIGFTCIHRVGAGSVGSVLAVQAWDHLYVVQSPAPVEKARRNYVCSYLALRETGGKIPGACWPAGLAWLASPKSHTCTHTVGGGGRVTGVCLSAWSISCVVSPKTVVICLVSVQSWLSLLMSLS